MEQSGRAQGAIRVQGREAAELPLAMESLEIWRGVAEHGERPRDQPRHVDAPAVIVAGGIWTAHLAATAGVQVPVMPVALSQCETEPVEPLIGPTLRCFDFGARQRPNGQLSMSAGMNTIVDHCLSLASLRDAGRGHAATWRTARRSVSTSTGDASRASFVAAPSAQPSTWRTPSSATPTRS
jgi:glycine/D-amino acid oxidase-like deaminating enzyme